MKTRLAIAIAAVLLAAAPALAQQDAPAGTEQADRVTMNRLTRQVRRLDRQTAELMDKAMAEARDSGGTASNETKARLLSLRDERDRLFSRMLILSMRHGWEIPDLDEPTATTSSRQEAEQSIFGSIDVLVRRRFAAEAVTIVHSVRLPVVSLESMEH